MKLPAFLGTKKLASASAVASAIAEHDTSLAATRTALERLDADRQAALLYGDDAALDAIDAKTREARLAVDRLQARREALSHQHAELIEAEAGEALTRRKAEAQDGAAAARKWINGRYAALAREMVAGLEKINDAEADVASVNTALAEAGRHEEAIGAVEPLQGYDEDGKIIIPLPAIAKLTRLVEIEGVAPGWGRVSYDEIWAGSVGLA